MEWALIVLAILWVFTFSAYFKQWTARNELVVELSDAQAKLKETTADLDEADDVLIELMDSFEFYRAVHQRPAETAWDEYDYMMIPRWDKMARYLARRYQTPLPEYETDDRLIVLPE